MNGDRKNKVFSSLADCLEENSSSLPNKIVDIKDSIYNELCKRKAHFNNNEISNSQMYKNLINKQIIEWYKNWYYVTNNIPLDRTPLEYKIVDVLDINDEDFINYKEPTFNIALGVSCTFKCGKNLCQNSELAKTKHIKCNIDDIIKRYLNQDISNTITLQGLEVLDNINQLLWFLYYFRQVCNDYIIIWTGYTKEECDDFIYLVDKLGYKNIIIKFGRYIPNDKPHYDEVLGINLASKNQYAEKIS